MSKLTERQSEILQLYFYKGLNQYEIAEELGLLDRVAEHGWKSLTSKETGRIGGLLNKRKHKN